MQVTNANKDAIEAAPQIRTEFRYTAIIECPDCPKEFETNPAAIYLGQILKCPNCGFIWIHDDN